MDYAKCALNEMHTQTHLCTIMLVPMENNTNTYSKSSTSVHVRLLLFFGIVRISGILLHYSMSTWKIVCVSYERETAIFCSWLPRQHTKSMTSLTFAQQTMPFDMQHIWHIVHIVLRVSQAPDEAAPTIHGNLPRRTLVYAFFFVWERNSFQCVFWTIHATRFVNGNGMDW